MARQKACVDQLGLVVESLNKLHANGRPLADALTRVAQQIALRRPAQPGAFDGNGDGRAFPRSFVQ